MLILAAFGDAFGRRLESDAFGRGNLCGACEGPSYGGTTILRGSEGVGLSVVLVRAPLTVAPRFSAQSNFSVVLVRVPLRALCPRHLRQ